MQISAKWLGLIAVAGLAGASFMPWTLGGTRVRTEIAQQFQASTGLTTTAGGPVIIQLLPYPQARIQTVSIRDRGNRFSVDAQEIRGSLRLLPLIAGRLELSSISLVLPAITIDASTLPLDNPTEIARAATAVAARSSTANAPKPAQTPLNTAASTVPSSNGYSAIGIVGGRLVIRNSSLAADSTQLGDVNATLDWRGPSEPLSLAGTFIWRGEKIKLTLRSASPAQLLESRPAQSTVRIESRLIDVTLVGAMASSGGWHYAGKVTAGSTALRPLISLANWNVPLPGPLASFKMSGNIRINPAVLSFTDLKLQIDSSEFDGALAIRHADQRPGISGTLATRLLKVDPRNAGLFNFNADDGGWEKRKFAIDKLFGADVDLRISASTLQIGRMSVEEAAVTALVRGNTGELSISSAKAYGGSLNAALRIVNGPVLPAFRGNLEFSKLDSNLLLRDFARLQRFGGVATGEIRFGAAGSSIADLVGATIGSVKFDLTDGYIRGMDLARALERAQTHPLSIPDEIRSGQTTFETAHFSGAINDGALTLNASRMDSAKLETLFLGKVLLPQKSLQLTVDSSRKPAASSNGPAVDQPTPATPRLKFDLAGSWNAPMVLVDPETLIQRSEAAAPLLRSIRRMRSQEAPASVQ
jgi:AsmA protein